MKNPRHLNTDYDAWLRRLQVEQLKKFYRTFQAILAGQCNDDIDVVRGKYLSYVKQWVEMFIALWNRFTMNYMELNNMKMSEAIEIILENPLTSLIDFVTLSMMFTCFYFALIIF